VSLLVIDKPSGPSSFAVCKRVRTLLGKRGEKVGHGGTLDPFASGVLPICMGEGTKVVPFLLDADKAYEAEVCFGVETDTLDCTGQVTATHPLAELDGGAVAAALAGFRGVIAQVPPMYSALKRNGRPLYSYARKGESVERPPRQVTVHALDLIDFAPPDRARLRLRCSKGTYVRSLAADLGTRLGVGAHLLALRRTASGPFTLENSISLEALAAQIEAGLPLPFVSELTALAHLPRLPVDATQALVLERGQAMSWAALVAGREVAGPACAIREATGGQSLVAIVTHDGNDGVRILRGFHGRG
jgi:tRNA pseudouridine55 synthase